MANGHTTLNILVLRFWNFRSLFLSLFGWSVSFDGTHGVVVKQEQEEEDVQPTANMDLDHIYSGHQLEELSTRSSIQMKWPTAIPR